MSVALVTKQPVLPRETKVPVVHFGYMTEHFIFKREHAICD